MRRIRLAAAFLFLLIAALWVALGAPITRGEFSALGAEAARARARLSARVYTVEAFWLMTGGGGGGSGGTGGTGGGANGSGGAWSANGANPSTASTPAAARSIPTISVRAMLARLEALSGGETLAVFLPENGAGQSARTVSVPLEAYVAGVLAAEMPASYPREALRAQAVAARTRAARQRADGGCATHAGADICAQSAHCQGYLDEAACAALWGDAASPYAARVLEAVSSTRGQVLTYGGAPIEVMYHAVSGGHTEDAAEVFSRAVPYLTGVESAGEEGARAFQTETVLPLSEAARLLNAAFPSARVRAETLPLQLFVRDRSQTGRALTLQVGDIEADARAVRAALSLKSTWFTIVSDEDDITFLQRGYGHGVGMSQAGAQAMAANGATFSDILSHYYRGTTLAAATPP